MLLRILILSVLCVACGKGSPSNTSTPPKVGYSPIYAESNSFFEDYTEEFLFQHLSVTNTAYVGELPPINFHDLKSVSYLSGTAINLSDHNFNSETESSNSMAGVCLSYPDGKKEILIDETLWNNISNGYGCQSTECYERKLALIFHELGHCLLNRKHKDDKHENYNLSIMNSVLIRQNDVVRWQEEYFEELFTENTVLLEDAINIYVTNP